MASRTISGGKTIEAKPKKTRQGTGQHTKYAASSRNSARKRYRGQGHQMYNHNVADEWNRILPQHLWIYNKLFLSRRLGYTCGPMGLEVPKPGFYVISPCTNLLECQSRVEYIECSTDHLHPGEFWCEMFEGDYLSVDYEYHEDRTGCYPQWMQEHSVDYHVKRQRRVLKHSEGTWTDVDVVVPYPNILTTIGLYRYGWINCEFVGEKLIEVHFRRARY